MLLDNLNKTKIREAFLAEETNSTSSNKKECDFCLMKGHTSLECRKFAAAKIYARKPRPPRKQTANTANNKQEQFIVVESAANASSCHISSSPLQIDASFDWNTDSYDTSFTLISQLHAISNAHSLSKRSHHLFVRVVEFTQVLHVPDLRTNLLSILYLTRQKQFIVTINSHEMKFTHDNTLLFTAQINENNAAFQSSIIISIQHLILSLSSHMLLVVTRFVGHASSSLMCQRTIYPQENTQKHTHRRVSA